MVKFSLQEKGQQLWNKKSTDKCKKIFDLYEHEVTNGRRSAGPIECFAFATESRRECYRLHAMVFLVFEITHRHRQVPRCRIVFPFFQNYDVTPEFQWLVFCLSHFELRSLRAFAGTSATS